MKKLILKAGISEIVYSFLKRKDLGYEIFIFFDEFIKPHMMAGKGIVIQQIQQLLTRGFRVFAK